MTGPSDDIRTQNKDERAASGAVAVLDGVVRVVSPEGIDATPSSPLRQAILAVVLLAPNQSKPRRSLSEMFWGGIDRKRASANLRTALNMLRRDLAPLGGDALQADRSAVWLKPGKIDVRPAAKDSGEFLEGIDLELNSCDGFEEWLRDMRVRRGVSENLETEPENAQDHEDHFGFHKSSVSRLSAPDIALSTSSRPLALGLLPALHASLSAAESLRVQSVMDALARFTMGVSWLVLHDLRGCEEPVAPLPLKTGTGPTHLLEPLVERRGRKLMLTLRLRDAASRLVWISDPTAIVSEHTDEIAASSAETMLEHLSARMVSADLPDLFPWTALTALFSLDADAIRRTETQIARMCEAGAPEAVSCIGHFAQVFKENEGVEAAQSITREQLCDLVAGVPPSSSMLPLWQSLAGYCAHMLLGDNDLAKAFLNASLKRSPTLSLNLDHIAVLRMSLGDLEGAEEAFHQCQRVGVGSPWRYTYDVTGAMLYMAKGDYRSSLHFANRALLRKPRFVGALRYAMAGFALAGNAKDAGIMHSRIMRLRPDYDMGGWLESMVRRSPGEIGQTLSRTFQNNGFI